MNNVLTISPTIANDTSTSYSIYCGNTLVFSGNVTVGDITGTTITDSSIGPAHIYDPGTGRKVLIVAGKGAGQSSTISSNSSTVLTLNTPISGGVDTTTVYEIWDCYGQETVKHLTLVPASFICDTSQNFPSGFLVGKNFVCTCGRTIYNNSGFSFTIVSNNFDSFVISPTTVTWNSRSD